MVLLISYDLLGGERPASYTRVKDYIERHSAACIRPLYSQWFVETTSSPETWVDALISNQLVDRGDRLFICCVTPPYQGLLTETDWTWLRSRI